MSTPNGNGGQPNFDPASNGTSPGGAPETQDDHDKRHGDTALSSGGNGVLPGRVEQQATSAAAHDVKSAYKIYVSDKNGEAIIEHDESGEIRDPDPYSPKAEHIYFAVTGNPLPTAQQTELQDKIDKVVRACDRLYLKGGKIQRDSFRIYFVRLFFLAQLALEKNLPTELANSLLASITSDLIEDEAAAMKNGHLIKLGRYALYYSIVPLLAYIAVTLFPSTVLVSALQKMKIDANFFCGFAMLWVGCFIGVWLSYGIRKTKISLTDLTLSEEDYLAPHIRMLFAGLLTMILGIMFALNFINLTIGTVSLTNITTSPLTGFLVGLFCGISEAALPASIGSRAATFIQNIK